MIAVKLAFFPRRAFGSRGKWRAAALLGSGAKGQGATQHESPDASTCRNRTKQPDRRSLAHPALSQLSYVEEKVTFRHHEALVTIEATHEILYQNHEAVNPPLGGIG